MRKKLTAIISILTLWTYMVGALMGCGSSNAGSGESAPTDSSTAAVSENESAGYDINETVRSQIPVIRIATWYSEDHTANLRAFLANEYPNYTFEFTYIQKANYESIIDTELTAHDLVDILFVTRELVSKHAKNGNLMPVTDICKGQFELEAESAFLYGNQMYAVPSVSTYECVYFNVELFDELGLAIPGDCKEFITICDKIIEDGRYMPLSMGLKDSKTMADSAIALLQDTYFLTDQGRTFGNRVQYERAAFYGELYPYLDDWYTLIDHNIFRKEMYIMDDAAALKEFAEGKTVMYVGGPENYNEMCLMNPELKLGTMPVGGGKGDNVSLIGGCDAGFAVNGATAHKERVMEVMKGLSSYKGQMALWADSPGSVTYLIGTTFDLPPEFDGVKGAFEEKMFLPSYHWGIHSREMVIVLGQELQKVLLGKETLNMALMRTDVKVRAIVNQD